MTKKTKKIEVEEPQVEDVVVEQPVVEAVKPEPKPQPKKEQPKLSNSEQDWEIKDRMYLLKHGKAPLTYLIRGSNIYYFDEKLGYERELKYTKNQRTCFVDEMKGEQRLEHIIFRNGILIVPKNKTVLQKLLSLYHPHKDKVYIEFKPESRAASDIEILELQADAILAAGSMDIDMAEAIMRVELGSNVSKMSSKEIKRDLLIFARNNPSVFLELASDDNVQLRNFGIKATETGIIKLSSDQRTFMWGSNDRKLMTVPFDEHPYSALAAWFKTDEGMEIYSNIEKRLK